MQNDVDDADGVDIDPSCLKRSSLGAIHFFALKTFRAILPHFPSPISSSYLGEYWIGGGEEILSREPISIQSAFWTNFCHSFRDRVLWLRIFGIPAVLFGKWVQYFRILPGLDCWRIPGILFETRSGSFSIMWPRILAIDLPRIDWNKHGLLSAVDELLVIDY